MITLLKIKVAYQRLDSIYDAEYQRIVDKVMMRERQIDRLKKKQERHAKTFPYWTEKFLRPLIEEVVKRTPELEWREDDLDRLCPMGIRSSVSFFPQYKGKSTMLVIVPMDLRAGELGMENGKKRIPESQYSRGTLGDVNGMNNVTVPIESIDQIVQHLKAQIKRGNDG